MGRARYRANPQFRAEAQRDPDVVEAKRQLGHQIAIDAEAIAAAHSSSYQADMRSRAGGKVTVEARTTTAEGVRSIAGWLEFGGESGEGTVPMLRPLGRAAMENGATVRESF